MAGVAVMIRNWLRVAVPVALACAAGGFDPFEPAATVAAAVAPLRFVRPPFVAITPTSNGEIHFTAAIRMNRELPRDRDKSVDATIHMQGATAGITVAHIGPFRWHCYLQPIELFIPKALRHPHIGQSVLVTLYVQGVPALRARVRLHRSPAPTLYADVPYEHALRCGT